MHIRILLFLTALLFGSKNWIHAQEALGNEPPLVPISSLELLDASLPLYSLSHDWREGIVEVEILVGADGIPISAKASGNSEARLKSAQQSALNYRFKPIPAPVRTKLHFIYTRLWWAKPTVAPKPITSPLLKQFFAEEGTDPFFRSRLTGLAGASVRLAVPEEVPPALQAFEFDLGSDKFRYNELAMVSPNLKLAFSIEDFEVVSQLGISHEFIPTSGRINSGFLQIFKDLEHFEWNSHHSDAELYTLATKKLFQAFIAKEVSFVFRNQGGEFNETYLFLFNKTSQECVAIQASALRPKDFVDVKFHPWLKQLEFGPDKYFKNAKFDSEDALSYSVGEANSNGTSVWVSKLWVSRKLRILTNNEIQRMVRAWMDAQKASFNLVSDDELFDTMKSVFNNKMKISNAAAIEYAGIMKWVFPANRSGEVMDLELKAIRKEELSKQQKERSKKVTELNSVRGELCGAVQMRLSYIQELEREKEVEQRSGVRNLKKVYEINSLIKTLEEVIQEKRVQFRRIFGREWKPGVDCK